MSILWGKSGCCFLRCWTPYVIQLCLLTMLIFGSTSSEDVIDDLSLTKSAMAYELFDNNIISRKGVIRIDVYNSYIPNERIPGCTAQLDGHIKKTDSNSRGSITFRNLDPDTYELKIIRAGFESMLLKDIYIGKADHKSLTIYLSPENAAKSASQLLVKDKYWVKRGTIHVSESDGIYNKSPKAKNIPYKIYVPKDNQYVSSGRTITYPLDVIILSHGAGQNREISTGYNGFGKYREGLATYWAKNGYIVICPTYRKIMRGLLGHRHWEPPSRDDCILYAITDFMSALSKDNAEEFFANRVRDLAFIRTHLEEILDDAAWSDNLYQEGESRVGLAGHSFGGVTTLAAAGVPVPVGENSIKLDLDNTFPFRRGDQFQRNEHDGSFIPADAYLLICASADGIPSSSLWLIDPDRPLMTGRDYVQKPLMVMTGTKDVVDENHYYDPVVLAHAINDDPAYGVVIEGANHITPIVEFGDIPSWRYVYGFLTDLMKATQSEDRKIGKKWKWKNKNEVFELDKSQSIFSEYHRNIVNRNPGILEDVQDHLKEHFPDREKKRFASLRAPIFRRKAKEKKRLNQFKRFTLSFWDTYISPEYNDPYDLKAGRSFLELFQGQFCNENCYDYIACFDYSPPTVYERIIDPRDQTPVGQFQDNGYVMLLKHQSEVKTEAPVIPPEGCSVQFIRKYNNENVAALDDNSGKLFIKGMLHENEYNPESHSEAVYVMREGGLEDGKPQIIIDSFGNLILRHEICNIKGE